MARISYCGLDERRLLTRRWCRGPQFCNRGRNIHAVAKEIPIRFDYDIADVDSHTQADCRRPIRDLTIAQAVLGLER